LPFQSASVRIGWWAKICCEGQASMAIRRSPFLASISVKKGRSSLKDVRYEDKEWEDAMAWEEKARKRLPELGMTIVDAPKEEIEKARKLARAGWDIWLTRTGPDGKRGMELALKALGR